MRRIITTVIVIGTLVLWGCDTAVHVGADDDVISLAQSQWDVQLQDGEPPESAWYIMFDQGASFMADTECGLLAGTYAEGEDHLLSFNVTHVGSRCDPPDSAGGPVSLIPFVDLLSSIDRYDRSGSSLSLLADEEVRLILEAR